MKKKDLIAAIAEFDDEDELLFNESPFLGEIRRICGKGSFGMIHKCVLAPNHLGSCYCACKDVYFEPDEE